MCFFELTNNEDGSFKVTLNEHHPIFKAHFPNYPILPGACTEEIIRKAAELTLDKKVRTKEIKQLKFIQVISIPEDKEVGLTLSSLEMEHETYLIKAILKGEAKTFCKAELIVNSADHD